jgi:redox-sensing transcriptional repressor
MKRLLPKATARRMPEYYRQFLRLKEQGIEVINSTDLGEYIKIEATTIRRDFSYIGEMGKQRVGYNVDKVINELRRSLGLEEARGVVLIGAGHLGSALFNYNYIKGNNIYITASYDSNPERIGKQIGDVTIEDIANLEKTAPKDIVSAILAVPSDQAQEMADRLVALGFKGFLNFSQNRINVPEDVIVETVDLASSLQTLMYLVDQNAAE